MTAKETPALNATTGAADRVEAWLWALPDEVVLEPPTVTELASLPLDKLSYRDAERLFLCLLETRCEVTYAKSYGTVGQAQGGIDVYGRRRTPPPTTAANEALTKADNGGCDAEEDADEAGDTRGRGQARRYVALQSKQVKNISPSDIAAAVTKFLEGTWPNQTAEFYFATTFDFRVKDLDRAVRDAADRLQAEGIVFIPWDAERINELLHDQPRLVERFFGRPWVAPFCGAEPLPRLANHKLDAVETRRLRAELRGLYRAAFAAVASLSPRDPARSDSFVILDVVPQPDAHAPGWEESGGPPASQATDEVGGPLDDSVGDAAGEPSPSVKQSALRRPRRSLRSIRSLLEDRRQRTGISGAIAADHWVAEGDKNLLVGVPGAGKSSLLRFVASDLLATEPTSAALQRSHGDRLPVWLPFGFLCHHLDADQANSLTSAVHAWLTSHSRRDLYPLVDKALEDDRLLLLIDGIDEWTSEKTANTALGAIETFLGHTKAAIVLTSRPYAVARLPFNLIWRQADVAPLDPDQQRRIASQYLVPPAQLATDADETVIAAHDRRTAMWSKANVEPFLAQLAGVAELQTLARTPLLLALLARSWRGEPLPPQRFDLYNLIVKMLVDTHPKMRARASKAGSQHLNSRDFLTLIQAVAYRLKADETPQPVPAKAMQKVIQAALVDEEILGYDEADARRMATEAMAMAEDEFGLLVPQGAKHVGFVHRVIGDHLAGCHLAELETDLQLEIFTAKHSDAAWTDVLLAALSAQTNKHTVATTLDTILDGLNDLAKAEAQWPRNILRRHGAWRFIGDALAADAKLAPRKAREIIDDLVHEVDSSPFLEYRGDLITKLVQAATTATNWRHLLPTFHRWLDSTRPYPGAAMWALRDLAIDDEDRVRRILVCGLNHDDATVRSNAVNSYATRYGSLTSTKKDDQTPEPRPLDPSLLEVIKIGPSARTQAAALMALAAGWQDDQATREHVEWARGTSKANLRSVALFAIAEANNVIPLAQLLDEDEYAFVMEALYNEGWRVEDHDWTGLNARLVIRAVSEASSEKKDELADFAATTLRQNPLGRGNRALCWQLACGPLAAYETLRDWAITELADTSDRHPLILYNLNEMPLAWTDYQPMKDALGVRIDDLLKGAWNANEPLTRALPDGEARSALLRALDDFRPTGAAHAILDRFPDDPIVAKALDQHFADDDRAAALASIAIRYLGPVDGFRRIYTLLRKLNATNPEQPAQDHVVVGQAVASGWRTLKQAAAGESTEMDPATAAKVLDSYDDKDVAAACTAIPTNGLGWHIADTIYTWPNLTVDYTLNELCSNRHISQGLPDHIHSAALRAHAEHPSKRSQEVLDLALGLMAPLPAELREVLAHELTQAPITPSQLLEATRPWRNDPDDGVRGTAAIGITQALQRRYNQPDAPVAHELGQWRETVRNMLCAYGPTHEEDRQIAWTCMLLLGEPSLLDGLVETIGEPTPSGVRLTDLDGSPDDLLVELIAQNWTTLVPHLGDHPLRRLTDARTKPDADEARALRALAGTAANAPAIADLLERTIAGEDDEGPTRRMLETTPGGIDYLITEEGRTAANLERVLRASDSDSDAGADRQGARERWAFTRLIEPWDVSCAELEATLQEAGAQERAHQATRGRFPSDGAVARAAHAMLFPHSKTVQALLADLTGWFEQPPEERWGGGPMTWLEATALTFMATPAEQLPVFLERIYDIRRLELAREPMWKFNTPLLHRLSTDPDAILFLIEALDGSAPTTRSPLFANPTPHIGPSEDDVVRRVFLIARTLKAAGQLIPNRLEIAMTTLRAGDPRLTVADPFIDESGPLHTLGANLAEG